MPAPKQHPFEIETASTLQGNREKYTSTQTLWKHVMSIFNNRSISLMYTSVWALRTLLLPRKKILGFGQQMYTKQRSEVIISAFGSIHR